MPLTPGTRLGPYQILEPLGAGGMGEVYRARDTRLDRTVAIKILPPDVSDDAERRNRFEREAKSIAALSHPHICTIHDVGRHENVDFLVMELLNGTTLDVKLKSGPLPLADVLLYARQIAEGLSAAHGRGIVHRDLKPANVMLTPSGAKLLDFGLATAVTEPADAAGRTRTAALTEHGAVLGTPQYMAPEQLEGKPVDARTDVFALGALIYEMTTGHRAFNRTTTDMPGTPAALQRLVSVCLARDPDDRWSSARDVLLQLNGISATEATTDARGNRTASHRRERWGWIAAGVAVAGLASVLLYGRLGRDVIAPSRDLLSMLPADDTTLDEGAAPEVSPDGRHVAFVASDRSGKSAIYVRARDTNEARVLPSTEGATMPFWSPDSRRLAFFAQGQLKTIDLAGGAAHAIAPAPIPRGGSWGADDRIIFVPRVAAGPYVIPAGGGVATAAPMPEPVTEYATISGAPPGRPALFVPGGQAGAGRLRHPHRLAGLGRVKGTGSIDGKRALCAAGLPRLPSRFVTSRPAARSTHSGAERQSRTDCRGRRHAPHDLARALLCLRQWGRRLSDFCPEHGAGLVRSTRQAAERAGTAGRLHVAVFQRRRKARHL